MLVTNSESVDWRKFLLVVALPWPIPLEEELLETLQRFKALDSSSSGVEGAAAEAVLQSQAPPCPSSWDLHTAPATCLCAS